MKQSEDKTNTTNNTTNNTQWEQLIIKDKWFNLHLTQPNFDYLLLFFFSTYIVNKR